MSDFQGIARSDARAAALQAALERAIADQAETPKHRRLHDRLHFININSVPFIDADATNLNSRYSQAVQISEIEEICRRMEAKQDNLVNYVSRGQTEHLSLREGESVVADQTLDGHRLVRVTVVIRSAAKLVLALLLTSLATWTYSDFPIVNPFISLLGIVACPFFFWIANSIESQEAKN